MDYLRLFWFMAIALLPLWIGAIGCVVVMVESTIKGGDI